jgi:peptide/nickel transport system ATP-binding protein
VLSVEKLSVNRKGKTILQDVSLSLAPGNTLAIVGESGAGKSTLIAAILGLVRYSARQLTWDSKPIRHCRPALVMQEPRSAFNPRLALRHSLMEPLLARRMLINPERLSTLCKSLEISLDLLDRRPAEVSIGQAQRIGILP